MKYLLYILLFIGLIFSTQITSKEIIQQTLADTGIQVIEVGTTEDGAVIVYDLGTTMSQGNILTASTVCLVLLADEYPESEMVFAIARVGEMDVFVTYAETKDVLAYRDEQLAPELFAEKIYGKILITEGVGSESCCGTAAILLLSIPFLYFVKTNL